MNKPSGLDKITNPFFMNILLSTPRLDRGRWDIASSLAAECQRQFPASRVTVWLLNPEPMSPMGPTYRGRDQIPEVPIEKRQLADLAKFVHMEGNNKLAGAYPGTEWDARKLEWIVLFSGDMSIAPGMISHLCQCSVRMNAKQFKRGPAAKEWVRGVMNTLSGVDHGCGVVDLCRAIACDFGCTFFTTRLESTLERTLQVERWARSQGRGLDVVPWIAPAVILSADACRRAGGVEVLNQRFSEVVRSRPEPIVEGIGSGGCIVWCCSDDSAMKTVQGEGAYADWRVMSEELLGIEELLRSEQLLS